MVKIYPSILSADFSKLGEEIKELELANADGIHLDIMDGKFVNNITFGMPVVKKIRKCTNLLFDAHLMIEDPEKYIDSFAEAGADLITFHIETVKDVKKVINQIRKCGKKVGISVKPNTSIPTIDILKLVDLVLVMSVEPGFGGQKYMEVANDKLKELARLKRENNFTYEIEVDGGVNNDNVKNIAECGAEIMVMGSAIFNSEDKKKMILDIKSNM